MNSLYDQGFEMPIGSSRPVTLSQAAPREIRAGWLAFATHIAFEVRSAGGHVVPQEKPVRW
jgi:hypothetical protein